MWLGILTFRDVSPSLAEAHFLLQIKMHDTLLHDLFSLSAVLKTKEPLQSTVSMKCKLEPQIT